MNIADILSIHLLYSYESPCLVCSEISDHISCIEKIFSRLKFSDYRDLFGFESCAVPYLPYLGIFSYISGNYVGILGKLQMTESYEESAFHLKYP